MIQGIVQHGAILPLEPIPPDWDDGQHVVIELSAGLSSDERARIEQWYADLEALGPAQYEPGERDAIEKFLADTDREAKESMKRSWARFDDTLSAGLRDGSTISVSYGCCCERFESGLSTREQPFYTVSCTMSCAGWGGPFLKSM